MSFFYYFVLAALLFVAVLLILLILIQKGRGGGLSNAFGGSGGTTAFGAKTGDVLTWVTSGAFVLFMVLAVALDLLVNSQYGTPTPAAASNGSVTTPAVPPNPTTSPARTPQEVMADLQRQMQKMAAATMPTLAPGTPGLPAGPTIQTVPPRAEPPTTRPTLSLPPVAMPTTTPTFSLPPITVPPTTRP